MHIMAIFFCLICVRIRGVPTLFRRVSESVQPTQPRRDYIDQSDVVVESHDVGVSSLESQTVTPPDLLAQGPLHTIRLFLCANHAHFVAILPEGRTFRFSVLAFYRFSCEGSTFSMIQCA